MRIVKIVAVWTLQILVGVMFVLLGVMKFRDPSWVRNFARWGYPDGFYMVIGVLEAVGGVGMLIPRFTTYAAVLLMAVMAGAALTHVARRDAMVPRAVCVLAVDLAGRMAAPEIGPAGSHAVGGTTGGGITIAPCRGC